MPPGFLSRRSPYQDCFGSAGERFDGRYTVRDQFSQRSPDCADARRATGPAVRQAWRRHIPQPDARGGNSDAAPARGDPSFARDRRMAVDPRVWPQVPVDGRMGSGAGKVRRPGHDLRHADDVVDRADHRRTGQFRHCALPDRTVAEMAEASVGHGDRTARSDSVDRLRHVGPAGLCSHPVQVRAAAAASRHSAMFRCSGRCFRERR